MTRRALVEKVLSRVDRRDSEGFADCLTHDAQFVFANLPAVHGRGAIVDALALFFGGLNGLAHTVEAVWDCGDTLITRGQVTYTRLDGSMLTVPFANIWHMDGDAVRDYRVYVDASKL